MVEAANGIEKIGGMTYQRATLTVKEENMLIMPVGAFRRELLKDADYDAEVHEKQQGSDGFTFMLINLVDQVDNDIIPGTVEYAVYDTKRREMTLCNGVELPETSRRLKLSSKTDKDILYVYLMRKFKGTVKQYGEYLCYDDKRLNYYKGKDAKSLLKPIFKTKGPQTAFEKRQVIRRLMGN